VVQDSATPTAITVRERHTGGGRAVLEISYDGAAPPLAPFEELRSCGWTGLVPTPPPASAIDWERPDPSAGTPYSIRPHRAAVVASLEDPTADRRAAVSMAQLVVAAAADGRRRPASAGPAEVVEVVCAAAVGDACGRPWNRWASCSRTAARCGR
jgi:hypothetical protein